MALSILRSVLDWDDVLSVPLVLARKPPSWLWFDEDKRTLHWSANRDTKPERDPTPDELLIKGHFDQLMSRASPTYIEDAYPGIHDFELWLALRLAALGLRLISKDVIDL